MEAAEKAVAGRVAETEAAEMAEGEWVAEGAEEEEKKGSVNTECKKNGCAKKLRGSFQRERQRVVPFVWAQHGAAVHLQGEPHEHCRHDRDRPGRFCSAVRILRQVASCHRARTTYSCVREPQVSGNEAHDQVRCSARASVAESAETRTRYRPAAFRLVAAGRLCTTSPRTR